MRPGRITKDVTIIAGLASIIVAITMAGVFVMWATLRLIDWVVK